jgi:hypothetical protein
MSKSQISMGEIFVALFIFFILLTAGLFAWNRYGFNLQNQIEYKEMQIIALQRYDQLSKKSGSPKNWEQNISSLEIIGLVDENGDFSSDKVVSFVNLNYTIAKEKLNIKKYEYYLEAKDLNNNIIFRAGISPYINNTCGQNFISVSLTRYLKYQGNNTITNFILWDDLCTRNTSPYEYYIIDESLPIVTLVFPEDNYESPRNNMSFVYNVTDQDSEISNCSLMINSLLNETKTPIIKDTNQTFWLYLSNGDYTWSVSCTDSDNNEATSIISIG